MRKTMKKCIAFVLASVLVISGLLAGGFGNVNAKAETKKIEDILPEDFPIDSVANPWQNSNGKSIMCDETKNRLKIPISTSNNAEIDVGTELALAEYGYYYNGAPSRPYLQFYMEDGKLVKIKVSGSVVGTDFKGDYTKKITIAGIMPDDFPTVSEWGWKNEAGKIIYSFEQRLYFYIENTYSGVQMIPISTELTSSGGNYTYYNFDKNYTLTFFMDETTGEFTSIELSGDGVTGGYDGSFNKVPSIKDILPQDFPSSDDKHSVPNNAWVNGNGVTSYVCRTNTGDDLCFNYGGIVNSFNINAELSYDSENSRYACDMNRIYFYKDGESLDKITLQGFTNFTQFNGEYKQPKYTIADILPDDFPVLWQGVNLWAHEDDIGKIIGYLPGTNTIRYFTHDGGDYIDIDVTKELLGTSPNYTYSQNGITFSFIMEDDKLVRIHTEGDNQQDTHKGNYIKYPTIADILPDDFPSSSSEDVIPENAWVNEKGAAIFAIDYALFAKSVSMYNGFSLEFPLTYDADNKVYEWENASRKLSLYMDPNGSLCKITFYYSTYYGDIYGTYFPKESYTVTNAAKYDDVSTNHGYITIDKDSARQGETVTVTVYPSENYRLKSLPKYELSGKTYYGSNGANDNEYTFSMPDSDIIITAEFEEDLTPKYDVIVSSNDEEYGSAVATVDGETVEKAAKDATVILKATPKSGYVFDHWDVTEGDVQIEDNTSFTMPDKTVKVMAVFERGTTPPEPKTYKISSTKEGASIDYDDDSLVVGIENDSEQKAYIHYDKQLNEVYITQTQDAPTEGCVDCIPVNQGETAKIVLKDCGFQLGTPIKVFKNELYGSAKPEPTPENKIPEHVHNYVWKEISAATSYSDGLEGEVCTVCGDIRNSNAISALGFAIENYAMPMIQAAKAGQTITFEFGEWNSFPNKMMQVIAQRSKENITFVFHYKWNKKKQEVVIPAGTEFDTTLDWYGPATMQRLFGEYELKK